ncbi:DNA cytosine methyltransferase [Luteimonas sp. XNQY3]|nr:DNA cytosine methyltransferase [Luteimonas sp. XNQY3]MCD9008062.1 DNA cytosine methyltransferase [Luteimonas sp. XNQY3]
MNEPTLQYGSVCSGIEAVTLAWKPLGWHPAWFSEVDPFPNAVLAHRYPDVPNLGDMTLIAGRVRAGDVLAPDILVGGTPCQAFSVAGARQGLSDPRGVLTLKFTELADAIDLTRQEQDQEPSVVVWENVPGVLSDKSNAFGCLLGALAGEGSALEPPGPRWTNVGSVFGPRRSIAWRIVDAQHYGVAQRRRRVFLVASCRTRFNPAEVLFEPYRLHGNPAPGTEAAQAAAAPVGEDVDRPGRFFGGLNRPYRQTTVTVCFGGGTTSGAIDTAPCLTARGHKCDFDIETFAVQSCTGQVSHALNTANGGKGCSEDGSGRGVPTIAHRVLSPAPMAFAQNSRGEVRLESGHGHIAGTLCAGGKPAYGLPAIVSPASDAEATPDAQPHGIPTHDARDQQDGNGHPIIAFTATDYGADAHEGIAPTLRAGNHTASHTNGGVVPAIAFDAGDPLFDAAGMTRSVALRGRDGGTAAELGDEIGHALRASSGGSDKAHVLLPSIEAEYVGRLLTPEESGWSEWSEWSGWRVRRLLPVECERLQGIPDDFTLVPYRGKPAADAPRYKAIGNSMAVPCVAWLGRRLAHALRPEPRPVVTGRSRTGTAHRNRRSSASRASTPTPARNARVGSPRGASSTSVRRRGH